MLLAIRRISPTPLALRSSSPNRRSRKRPQGSIKRQRRKRCEAKRAAASSAKRTGDKGAATQKSSTGASKNRSGRQPPIAQKSCWRLVPPNEAACSWEPLPERARGHGAACGAVPSGHASGQRGRGKGTASSCRLDASPVPKDTGGGAASRRVDGTRLDRRLRRRRRALGRPSQRPPKGRGAGGGLPRRHKERTRRHDRASRRRVRECGVP